IRRHLRHEPVLAGPPSVAYRLRKLARKHRTAVTAAVAVLAAAVAAGAFLVYRAERAYRGTVEAARAAVDARRLQDARTALATLLQSHFGRREVRELEGSVAALEAALRSEESAALLAAAGRDWRRHLERRGEERELARAWQEKRLALPTYAPPWQRGEELEIHDRLEAARREAQDLYESAAAAFQRAIEAAPRGSEAEARARTAFALAYQAMQAFADREGGVAFGPDFFRRRGADLDAALFARRGGTVRVKSQPPGADVLLYRYEERERRLLPLPFDPGRTKESADQGLLAEPALVVADVAAEGLSPFRSGDRLLEVAGRPLRLEGDLARALDGVGLDGAVEALVERGGEKTSIAWTPFPRSRYGALDPDRRLEPGKLVNAREQLGFALAGYPLERAEGCRLGRTRAEAPLESQLPDGSYLLVLRLEGHLETRVPLRIAGKDVASEVRLLPEAEVPPGFVHVPAGPFTRGGDPEAFQSFALEEVHVEGFLMARHEVTFEEYLQFLNDPVAAIDESGEGVPTEEEARAYARRQVERGKQARDVIDLVPRWDSGASLVRREAGGRWTLDPAQVPSPRWPVFGVSRFAAEEYAHWLTARRPSPAVARFRLPTDDEWEKAARGADRRRFVWGDYPVWSFAWIHRGIHRREKQPEEVGWAPADESVYGVRDLAGSVSEHAVGQPSRPYRYSSVRGGNWFNTDEYYARAATRNGILPEGRAQSIGFRVAGELRPAAR
ncbi:MAG: SUMF1/EgtB/PvdO family nonheme iron enzyme, partial [Planctomycetes bacterium]|nr:SUMF1/EgtB/PvdO family nonheme iron enzyme [Planctomycetota bacterium]